MALHLWRSKENIIESATDGLELVEIARNRRLTSKEVLQLHTLLLNIESWAADLPDVHLSLWDRLKSKLGL